MLWQSATFLSSIAHVFPQQTAALLMQPRQETDYQLHTRSISVLQQFTATVKQNTRQIVRYEYESN